MPRKKVDVIPDFRLADMEERVRAVEGKSQDHSWTVVVLAILLAALAVKVWFYPSQSTASANAINVHRDDIDGLERRMDRAEYYMDKQNEWLYKFEDRTRRLEYKTGLVPTPAPAPVPKPCVPAPCWNTHYYYVSPNWTSGCVYVGTYIPNCNR